MEVSVDRASPEARTLELGWSGSPKLRVEGGDVYAEHYNRARPHRSMDLRPPDPAPSAEGVAGSRVRRRDVLGGLIHEYQRARHDS